MGLPAQCTGLSLGTAQTRDHYTNPDFKTDTDTAGKVAQWLRMLTACAEDQSLVPSSKGSNALD